jgi:hypothetical protein
MSDESAINSLNKITIDSRNCESGVLDCKTLNECDNKCSIPIGRTGPLVAKIPVVLSDLTIQIDIEAKLKLEEPALDIKTIDKHIYLTECNLVPHTDKLFISGYVQKNIQFSSISCTNNTSVNGHIYHTTVNVPFKCVTKIQFSKYPVYGKDYKVKLNVLDKKMLSKDQKEDSWIHYSKLYEPVYCELEYAKILETDILDREFNLQDTLIEETAFQELNEKMVIYIRLKVLQNQQVCIPEPHGEVSVMETYPPSYKDYNDKKNINIEVGYDPEKGMIGREVPSNGFDED